MSLLVKWVGKTKKNVPSTEQCILDSLLPDPNLEYMPEKLKTIQVANTEALEVQVYLIITLSLGSIETDRVINETVL